ncbi:MAG: hypothetical protein F4Y99_09385 [Acidimicrobiaceae bacterium]|nr:hypothetical protein [Acidimicrobiaceae bacterium]MDE0516830.1 hypothetical protein [Acidimicrobiaceae bacterium]MDE0655465.1 hypothetical protein [Acidimicrobiaceae bacterium]MXZ96124.1 hypothetical protein [Acidimicrobiaceae bacterium]MYF43615.1 hypothetical protein [Acidimicrobiaceae bacterium]
MRGSDDPVLERRQRLARLARSGRRLGYSLYGVSLAAFVAGFVTGFTTAPATIAAVTLVAGSLVLLPSIIIGYGVSAADRADRDDDW